MAEICVRLDGLPLALELAAARIKVFAPRALLQRLSHPLRLLTGGTQDRHARHHGLRDTIAWSYNLLTEEEQQLFRQLAVFVGGCTIEAAAAVCNGVNNPGGDLVNDLTSLADKSLLRPGDGVGGEPRFIMLATIRAYALERLAESGLEEGARQRHVEYFLQLAETAESEQIGLHNVAWLDRLEEEQGNLRAALEWALHTGSKLEQQMMGLRLAGTMWGVWRKRSYYREGRQWLAALLATTDRTGRLSSPEGVALRDQVLAGARRIALAPFEVPPGTTLWEEARVLGEQASDRAQLAQAPNNLGWGLTLEGDVERSRALVEEHLQRYRELDDQRGIALALFTQAFAARAHGHDQQALALLEESQALFQLVHDTGGLAWSCWLVGVVRFGQCDYRRAAEPFERAIALFRAAGEQRGLIAALQSLGLVVRDRGDYASAVSLHEEALRLSRDMGDLGTTEWIQILMLGRLAYLRGDPAAASALHEEGLRIARQADGLPDT